MCKKQSYHSRFLVAMVTQQMATLWMGSRNCLLSFFKTLFYLSTLKIWLESNNFLKINSPFNVDTSRPISQERTTNKISFSGQKNVQSPFKRSSFIPNRIQDPNKGGDLEQVVPYRPVTESHYREHLTKVGLFHGDKNCRLCVGELVQQASHWSKNSE